MRIPTLGRLTQNTHHADSGEPHLYISNRFSLCSLGFRLNSSVVMTKFVTQWLECVIKCVNEPCCRSMNYKKTLMQELMKQIVKCCRTWSITHLRKIWKGTFLMIRIIWLNHKRCRAEEVWGLYRHATRSDATYCILAISRHDSFILRWAVVVFTTQGEVNTIFKCLDLFSHCVSENKTSLDEYIGFYYSLSFEARFGLASGGLSWIHIQLANSLKAYVSFKWNMPPTVD